MVRRTRASRRAAAYGRSTRGTANATQLAGGLAGATNLALGRHGTIYVSEIFAGRVSRIDHGTVTPLIDVPTPGALEYAHGKLYVGYDVFEPSGNGKVGTISW